MKKLLALLALVATTAQGASIAVIDSGTDLLHKDLYDKAWINQGEIEANDIDDDNNGFVDDIHGWNFAESNNETIDYSYMGTLTYDIRRFFEIQTKSFYGTATEEEKNWVKRKMQDADFVKSLQVYGNFMHGTHVAGIAAQDADLAKIMAVKIIPTEVKLPFSVTQEKNNDIILMLMKQGLKLLATQQMTMLQTVARYVDSHKIEIANGSFGTGYPQAKMIVETLANTVMARNPPTPEQVHDLTVEFLNHLIKEGDHMVQAAQDTLFVFAAGNDGLDNDKFPTSPTNIQSDNVISVAATLGFDDIATFSNYGVKMVDVAAPGVGIDSAVPGNKYLQVSGTSQAAPYVANVAGQIKDANKDLSPRDIKKILIGTVDIRDWLVGKVKSSGTVNTARAVRAAELTSTMNVDMAIRQSIRDVADVPATGEFADKSARDMGVVLPLPSMFKL
jgi:cell wall-associated protease